MKVKRLSPIMLQKALQMIAKANGQISVDNLTSGGLLTPTQRKTFIDFIFESTPIMDRITRQTLPSPKHEVDGLLVPARQTRGVGINQPSLTQGARDSEDQSKYFRKINTFKMEFDAQEFVLPYALSENMLMDNIEGKAFAAHVARLFATLVGVDMEDSAINGQKVDPTGAFSTTISGAHTDAQLTITLASVAGLPVDPRGSGYIRVNHGIGTPGYELISYNGITGTTLQNCVRTAYNDDEDEASNHTGGPGYAGGEAVIWYRHHLLGVLDGWLYKIRNPLGVEPGGNIVDGSAINGGDISEKHFFTAIETMPKKYRRLLSGSLIWMMNDNSFNRIQERISRRAGASTLADSVISGTNWNPMGKTVLTSPQFPEDEILLTTPSNLNLGIWKNIEIRSTREGLNAIAKNERYFTTRLRTDVQVERKDACVIIEKVNTIIP